MTAAAGTLGITGVAGLAAIGAYKVKNNNTNEDEE